MVSVGRVVDKRINGHFRARMGIRAGCAGGAGYAQGPARRASEGFRATPRGPLGLQNVRRTPPREYVARVWLRVPAIGRRGRGDPAPTVGAGSPRPFASPAPRSRPAFRPSAGPWYNAAIGRSFRGNSLHVD